MSLTYNIDGNDSGLARAIASAKSNFSGLEGAAKNGVGGITNSIAGIHPALGLVVAGVAALTAVLAGIGNAVRSTTEAAESTMDLARALGVSTNEATVARMAMDDIGASQGDLETAGKGLVKQLRKNEEGLQAMGLKTRDASGNLRPLNDLIVDGIGVLGTYKEGTDRNAAAQEIFGKGIDGSSRLMLLNKQTMDDSRQAMQELGLEVGENSVAAWKEYDAASDRAGFSVKGMTKAIGDSLLPVVTTLTEIFNAIMPAAIVVVRGALGGLTTAFLAVRNGVVVVWEVINAMVVSVAEPIRALAVAIGKALTGDFAGAKDAIMNVGSTIKTAWSGAFDNIAASSQKTHDQIARLWSSDTKAGSGGGMQGNKGFVSKEKKEKTAKEPAEESMMTFFEQQLTQRKLTYERENLLRQFSKEQELAYWNEMLQRKDLIEKDRAKIVQNAAKVELEILRESAKKKHDLDIERTKQNAELTMLAVESDKTAEMHRIEMLSEAANQELELGRMTEADHLARQQVFNQARLEAELAFLEAKRQIALLDPDKNVVLLEQLEMQKQEIRNRYALQETKLANQQALQAVQRQKSMQSTLEGSLSTFFSSWWSKEKTFAQARDELYASWAKSVIGMIADMAAKWVATKIMEMIFGKTAAASNVAGHAAEAGAGGVASMAAAPFPLNLSAPAFGLAMSASAMAFGGLLASASGGFDIPSGMNPLTQLHEQEMVLPAHIANPLRENLADGGGMGGGAPIIINTSGGDFIHKKDLAKMLSKMNRDYQFT